MAARDLGLDDALALRGLVADKRLTLAPTSKLVNKIGNKGSRILDINSV